MKASGAGAPQPARARPSFWRSMRMVGWGLLGVRQKDGYQRDLAEVRPLHVIIAAGIAVALLVLGLIALVHFVVAAGPHAG